MLSLGSVAFAVLVRPSQVLCQLPFEHLVHVHVRAGEAACVEHIEYDVDEFLCDFFFRLAFFPSVAGFAQFNKGEQEFFGDVFGFIAEAFSYDELFDFFLHVF